MVAIGVDEGRPAGGGDAQGLGFGHAGVAFDGVQGQAEAAGAAEQADALAEEVVDLVPAFPGGLLAYSTGAGRVDGGPAAGVRADLELDFVAQVVGSDRGALAGLLPVGFPGPPALPGVPVSGHRALHEIMPLESDRSEHPATGEAGSRPAAQLPRHLGHLPGKPHSAALMTLQQARNLLAEGLPPAAQDRTDQPPYAQVDDHLAAVDRHVRHRPAVIPVHLRRQRPARGTRHRRIPSASRDHHRVTTVRHVHDDQHRQPGKHRTDKGVDIHHQIMIKDGYPASPPTTGQSRTSHSPPPGCGPCRSRHRPFTARRSALI